MSKLFPFKTVFSVIMSLCLCVPLKWFDLFQLCVGDKSKEFVPKT